MPLTGTRSPRYSWIVIIISSLLTGVTAVGISLRQNQVSVHRLEEVRRASDQKWCSIVETLDDSYHYVPPTTPAGKQVAAAIADLRSQLPCPRFGATPTPNPSPS